MKRAIISIAALTFFVAGCSSSSSDEDSGGFSQDVRNNFIQSCKITSGGLESYCKCMLASAEKRFTEEEFAQLDRTVIKSGMDGLSASDRDWLQKTAPGCLD